MTKFYIFLITFSLTGLCTFAQSTSPYVISSGGSNTSGSYGLSSTIGELAVSSFENGSYYLNQGFQRGYLLFESKIEEKDFAWSVSAYPNPVRDNISVCFDLDESTDFVIEIFDLTGKRLKSEEIKKGSKKHIQSIDFSNYESGIYILNIFSVAKNAKKTFKISKL